VVSLSWPTVYNNKNQCDNCKQHESFSCNTMHWSQSLRCAQVINCKGYVVSRQDTNRNNTNCMLSVQCHYNTTPVTPCSTEHFLKCFLTAHLRLYKPTVGHINNMKAVCILNVLVDDVSIELLYRNALDIHCKHTASQLHVAGRVLWGHHCGWISSDKCHTWTKYLHCVTSADVFWVVLAT